MTWTRGPTIGRGATATVSLATTDWGDLFAVKSTDLTSSALLQNEECLISRLCSPYIIKCLGSDVTHELGKSVYNIFLEYCARGALSHVIRKEGSRFDEARIRFFSHQLLLGIEYLHRNGVVHCDIKAQNILVGGDGLKIADFGCAKWSESGFPAEGFSGTAAYMAPEVARGEEQSFPADIWSLGCTVIEMATGKHPWPEMKDPAAAVYRIGFSGDVPEFPSWFSGEARDFLGKCLERDSKRRWTAAELLKHPFFAAVEEGSGEIKRESPTSVMERGFWDDVDGSESCENIPVTSVSPASRVAELVCGGGLWWRDMEEEEGWMTVRSDGVEECEDSDEDLEEEGIGGVDLVVMEDCSFFDFCNQDYACKNVYNLYLEFLVLKIVLMELFVHQEPNFLLPLSVTICCCCLVLLIFVFKFLLIAILKNIWFYDDDFDDLIAKSLK